MNAYSPADFARSFRTVRKNTIQIAKDIPEDQWGFRPTPETRSVAELLAHIAALTYTQTRVNFIDRKTFMSMEGFRAYSAEATAYTQSLTTRAAILQALETEGEAFASRLDAMTDADLAERVQFAPPLDPPSKSRFELLLGVKEHEMHHRGQLMLILRLLGGVPHLTRQRQAQAQPAAARS
jgi:uncharacterized damage-inducible protein DinB